MTRREEYQSTILTIYESGKNFIKMSKKYGLGKEQLDFVVDEYTQFFNVIMLCALRDDFIRKDDYNELLDYIDRLLDYLKECLE